MFKLFCTIVSFPPTGIDPLNDIRDLIGRGSFVGAGALVTPGTIIPPGSLVLGSPAKVKRPITAAEREQIEYGARHYVELARDYLASEDRSSVR